MAGQPKRERVWVEVPGDSEKLARMKRLVDVIAIVAILDALLLGVLLYASFTDSDLISILGPIHGAGFVALIVMCVKGVSEEYWGWWFPAIVIVTLGPIGSLIGDLRVRETLNA